MMKVAVLILGILFTGNIFGNTIDSKYEDLRLNKKDYYDQLALELIKKINPKLSKNGFLPYNDTILPEFFFAQQAYQHDESQIYFRLGLKYPKEFEGKYIPLNDGFLYHTTSNESLAIYMRNISKPQMKAIVNRFKTEFESVTKKFVYIPLFGIDSVSTAQSSVDCNCQTVLPASIMPFTAASSLTTVASSGFWTNAWSSLSSCAMTAFRQAYEATVGTVRDVGQGIWNFVKNPIRGVQNAWEGAVNMVNVVGDFIGNFREQMSGIVDALTGVSHEFVMSILCGVIGGIGAGTLVRMLGNPVAGMASAMARVATLSRTLNNSIDVIKAIDRAKRYFTDVPRHLGIIADNLLNSSAAGLRAMNRLVNNGFEKLVYRKAVCGI